MAHTYTIRHCKLARTVRACDSRNYRRVIIEISTCWPMEFYVRYNNTKYQGGHMMRNADARTVRSRQETFNSNGGHEA